jgi:hypothetical protein
MTRFPLVKHIKIVLTNLGGTLSTDREEQLYQMRVSELERLGALIMGGGTFRNAVKLLIGSIADSQRIQLASN